MMYNKNQVRRSGQAIDNSQYEILLVGAMPRMTGYSLCFRVSGRVMDGIQPDRFDIMAPAILPHALSLV